MRAAFPAERGGRMFEVADDGAAAAALEVADGRFHLGAHAAAREVAIALVLLQFTEGDLRKLALRGLSEVDGDALHGGKDEKVGDAEGAREQRRGEVLVD